MKIILEWSNDYIVGNNPAASIDDITISKYCSPLLAYPQYLYFNRVSFVGTLNDVTNNSTYGVPTGDYVGYQNFTRLPSKASQAQGEGVNVSVQANALGRVKAWVDWNNDGDFSTAEEVYDTEANIATSSTIFGFVIPVTQTPGDYRIRIRNYREDLGSSYRYSYDFNACESFTTIWDEGETEDYLFTVTAQSSVKINSITDGQRCGAGDVNVAATGTAGTSVIRWYNMQVGGTLLGTSASGANFTIVGANASGEVWATAYDGTRENTNRKKVKYKIDPIPDINFSTLNPAICGIQNTNIVLTALGDKETVHLINEKFPVDLASSAFSNVVAGTTNVNANWILRQSSYIPAYPPYFTLKPAIASGFDADLFACAISDVNPGGSTDMRLTSKSSVNADLFTTLFLEYDLYYNTSAKGLQPTLEYANVEISINGGAWTVIKQYLNDYGLPNRFKHDKINISSYAGQTDIKIRFVTYSYALLNGWMGDIMALDNIELYGERPLAANFAWTAPNIDVFSPDCVSSYANGPSACFIPNATQLENYENWNINATATLSNGCPAVGKIKIINNSKIWNTGTTDWNTTNWKPNTAVPDDTKCVVVKTPVILGAGDAGAAKNLTVQGVTGNLTIAGNLTVTDYIKNETTPLGSNEGNLVLESDANLIQIDGNAANSGKMTAKRQVIGLVNNPAGNKVDYVYWSSPVAGQITKGTAPGAFSPGTPPNRFFYYLESNDRFYETGDPTFRLGRGYAVQAEADKGTAPYTKDYLFRGTPNNGDISFNIIKSSPTEFVHGYNLVGNPYPSNIKFDELYAGNSGLIYNTAWFWKNTTYTQYQQGSGYNGNNYAVYNGTGGLDAAAVPTGVSYNATIPNGIIKVGQGFLVQKKVLGTAPLNFKHFYTSGNKLRVSDTGEFFQKDATGKNRYWLSLLSPSNLLNSQLVGYIAGATDEYERDYDAEAFSLSSDLFYSVLPTKRLLIQGKSEAFTDEDKITLGANFFQNGTYTIALENAEGIFNGRQNIYLKDKQEGIITNLSQGSYSFTATAGDQATRFEIIYKPETILATGDGTKDDLVVYRNGGDFVVKSQSKKIDTIELYDTTGRLIYSTQPKNKEALIPAEKLINSVYVLKINRGGEITTKKLVR